MRLIECVSQDYLRYAEESRDELPLYVFDKRFADKCPELGREYEVPDVFSVRVFVLSSFLCSGFLALGIRFVVGRKNATCRWWW